MGHNTAVIILGDAIEQIRNDAEAGRKIAEACERADAQQRRIDVRLGNHSNALSVLPSQHADFDQVIVLGGNWHRVVAACHGNPLNKDAEPLGVKRLGRFLLDYAERKWRQVSSSTSPEYHVYVRQIDESWHVCAKGDPGAVLFIPALISE